MRNLLHSVHSPEHSIGGVTDPFLQVRLIKLLCKLTSGQPAEETCDCLAQVSTNTDSAKNAGNAVLYECVKTILDVQSTSGLRVLATNIMGRFLMSRDNNLRYVALNSLLRLVKIDPVAVQRHKTTIMDCLKDSDLVIKKRALELTSVLINENNVKQIVKELIDYLLSAEVELKEAIVAKLCSALEVHSPSKQWTIDTLTQILSVAGGFVPDEVISSTAHIVSSSPELQAYTVHKLFRALKDNTDQQGLVLLSVWCIGEYGDLITRSKVTFPDITYNPVPPSELFNILEKILISQSSDLCKEYVLTCLAKLTVRAPDYREHFKKLLSSQSSALNIEIQQRACEYLQLLQDNWDPVRAPLLERMPIFSKYAASSPTEPAKAEKTEEVWMLDLLGDGSAPLLQSAPSATAGAIPKANTEGLSLVTDLLGGLDLTDIYASKPTSGPNYPSGLIQSDAPAYTATPPLQGNNLIELGHGDEDFHEFQSAEPVPAVIVAFEDDEISIHFHWTTGETPADTVISCVSRNKTKAEIKDYKLFSAVQKHLVLNLAAASNTKMGPGEVITQQIKIHNTQHKAKPIVVRLKIDYNVEGYTRSKIATVDSFPNI